MPLALVVETRTGFSLPTLTSDLAASNGRTKTSNISLSISSEVLDSFDRHHAEIIPIEGESYRKREAELTQKKRRGSP